MKKLPVTAIVPTLNEEANLAQCLSALDRFERVIVVDSGSTDDTLAISRRYGAEVVDFRWNGRFPKKRNWCLRNLDIEHPWVLFIDADEVVTPEFEEELARVLPETTHDAFYLRFETYFMGRIMRHGVGFRKIALLRVGAAEYEQVQEESWSRLDMEVHEHPVCRGTIGEIEAQIKHNDRKDLRTYIARHNEYSSWESQRYLRLKQGNDGEWVPHTFRQRIRYRLLDTWFLGPLYFIVSYFLKGGFLDGYPGFIYCLLKMQHMFNTRCKIIEARMREADRKVAQKTEKRD